MEDGVIAGVVLLLHEVVHDLQGGRGEEVDGERVAQGHGKVAKNLKEELKNVKLMDKMLY